MTVEFDPKGDCFCFGVANSTWFTLVRSGGPLHDVLAPDNNHLSNDPVDVDRDTALKCAAAMNEWNPPDGWHWPGKENAGKYMFILFFRHCDGFETH